MVNKNKNNKNSNSCNSLVFGLWPPTKICDTLYEGNFFSHTVNFLLVCLSGVLDLQRRAFLMNANFEMKGVCLVWIHPAFVDQS